MMRELRVEDALLYLDQVKVEFGDRPHIYNEFLDIMKTFKTQQIDTPGVIRRVSNLFQGNRRLVLGFNTFLPDGYKIEIPDEGPPVAVYRAPGSNVPHILRESAESQAVSVAVAAAAANQQMQMQQQQQQYGAGAGGGGVGSGGQPRGLQQPPPQRQLVDPFGVSPNGRPPPGKNVLPHDAGGVAPRQPHRDPLVPQRGQQQQQQLPGGIAPRQPPSSQQQQQPLMVKPRQQQELDAQGYSSPHLAQQPPQGFVPGNADAGQFGQQPDAAGQQQQQAVGPNGQPLEFDHAINYVTTIKRRFSTEPDTYKKFLEILHTYQKEQRGIKEVLDEVSDLFEDHPDLLKEFTFFLPDAVQAQAKVQLDQAAKEAEARKRAKAKSAIMNAAQGMQQTIQQQQQQSNNTRFAHDSHSIGNAAPSGGPWMQQTTRSAERETTIARGAQYGIVMFNPKLPPVKEKLTPSAAALKNGRPRAIPELPPQPSTSEESFFERAKQHLSRRELAADKPMGARRSHTPYKEFLKCLHLFGSNVLNKEELLLLLKGLFVQGHAPKSGIHATGGNHNATIAQDASELLRDFEEIIVGRGPYSEQEHARKDKSKFGAMRTRDFDLSDCDNPTPSYWKYPADYPHNLFHSNPGMSDADRLVLQDLVVCVDPMFTERRRDESSTARRSSEHESVSLKRHPTLEDSDAAKNRQNVYEETMFRIEDERYELDMAIEQNVHALRRIEPFAKEVQAFREQEEKDGQPIGRLRYQLHRFSLNSIHINAIGRLYGDRGDEILQHLLQNPLIVLPIIHVRLKEKDMEWRKRKSELLDEWNRVCAENYEGSMDVLCHFNQKVLEKSFTSTRLVNQCKRARSYIKHPEKVKDHVVSRAFMPAFRNQFPEALLFQPFIESACHVDISHKNAFSLLSHKINVLASYNGISSFHRERIGRIWAEFVVPWFRYPAHWVLNEVRESYAGTSTQYASGQRIMTIFGEGLIASYMEAGSNGSPMYRVKLPFGLAFLSPSAILYAVPSKDVHYVRRDGAMIRDDERLDVDGSGRTLQKEHRLLFGTERIYLFVRLYSLLCAVLSDTREECIKNPLVSEPSESYVTNPADKSTKRSSKRLDFSRLLDGLTKLLANDMTARDFETLGRKISKNKVHQIASLPRLIDRCIDALRRVVEEDTLLSLYDHCHCPSADPVALRTQCLSIVPDAVYRIQFDPSKSLLTFCHLESSMPLLTVPQGDTEEVDEDTNMDTGDDQMETEDDPIEEFAEIDTGVGAQPEAKRAKLE